MKKLFISGLFVSFALFLGRISGFLRELFIASSFGVSKTSDLIIVLLSIPDVLVNLLVGGALGMILVPEQKKYTQELARIFYLQVLYLGIIVFFIVALFLSLFSSELMHFFAPGLDSNDILSYQRYLKISLVAIPLTVAAGVTTARLNYQEKFFLPALGTLIFNVVLIVIIWLASKQSEEVSLLYCLSFGIIISAMIRWCGLIANDKFLLFDRNLLSHWLITISLLKKYIYCVLGSGFLFIIPVIVRATSSRQGEGMLSISNYAVKLVDFPLAVCLTVFSIIFLPKLSSLHVDKNNEKFTKVYWIAIYVVIFLSLLITVAMIVFSYQFTSAVYNWGGVSETDLRQVSNLLSIAIISLVFQGLNSFIISAHAAKNDTIRPLIITTSIVTIFSIICFNTHLTIESLLYLMCISYAAITVCLFFSITLKHRVFISHSTFHSLWKMLAIVVIYSLIMSFFYDSMVSTATAIFITLMLILSSMFAWFFIDDEIKNLGKFNNE
ncbi:murein biosynthesis integral membrane protein MurJ [Aeromonas bestiarum]|uniref:murein biosynthesis integral membrane protein MurJ n=2 Tax=Aeromonas TaxID=642 RepID=UPI0032B25B44